MKYCGNKDVLQNISDFYPAVVMETSFLLFYLAWAKNGVCTMLNFGFLRGLF